MASTTPLRIGSKLVNEARTSAAVHDRSPTAQIEHWAKLGRAVESVLTGSSVARVKEAARVPDMEALLTLSQSESGQQRARELIQKHGLPVYEADTRFPNLIIERQPDGTTRRGRFHNRKFVPEGGD